MLQRVDPLQCDVVFHEDEGEPKTRDFLRVNAVRLGPQGGAAVFQRCWNHPSCTKVVTQTAGVYAPCDLHKLIHIAFHKPIIHAELKHCGRCLRAAYCSSRCMKLHSKQHQHMCVAVKTQPPQLLEQKETVLLGALAKLVSNTWFEGASQRYADTVLCRCMAFIQAVGGIRCCMCHQTNIARSASGVEQMYGFRCFPRHHPGDSSDQKTFYLLFACFEACRLQLKNLPGSQIEALEAFGDVGLVYRSSYEAGNMKSLTTQVCLGEHRYRDVILEQAPSSDFYITK